MEVSALKMRPLHAIASVVWVVAIGAATVAPSTAPVTATPSQGSSTASTPPGAVKLVLPDGPGRAMTETLCGDCHSIASVVVRRYTPRGWQLQIADMAQHGAVYTDEEVETMTAYLSRHFGRVNMNRATADDLRAVLDFSDEQAAAVVAARAAGRTFTTMDDVFAVPGLERDFIQTREASIFFTGP